MRLEDIAEGHRKKLRRVDLRRTDEKHAGLRRTDETVLRMSKIDETGGYCRRP